MAERNFDLNIQDVLENWEVPDGLREIISNALDETLLSDAKPIDVIFDDNEVLHIRDYGRGISYEHFTQNENEEKLTNPSVIGKFGVGLKDALATFYRHGIDVTIESKHSVITLEKLSKPGFDDVPTLQAIINSPRNTEFQGTDFILKNVSLQDLAKAESNFLYFNKPDQIDSTDYGDIYKRDNDTAYIYINGVRVAEEPSFMFSYNITKKNKAISNALNRERTNVGRGAYTPTVKNILKLATSDAAISQMIKELKKDDSYDELTWKDIQIHAVVEANKTGNVVFTSTKKYRAMPLSQREEIERSGKELVTIKDATYESLPNFDDLGNPIMTVDEVIRQDAKKFNYQFIEPSELTVSEQSMLQIIPTVIAMLSYDMRYSQRIHISESINPADALTHADGLYRRSEDDIIILRKKLADKADFLGVLIHELAHANTGYGDVDRHFETALTQIIGMLASYRF